MVDYNKFGPLDVVYHWADQVFNGTQGVLVNNNIADFVESVTWNEPFIRALILAQCAIFAITYVTRRKDFTQFAILLFLTAVTLGAERINEYGSKNWTKFASQDYFDGPGLFMMVFVSGPFVLLANFIVINMGLRLVKLYAKKARRQVRLQAQQSSSASAPVSSMSGSARADGKKDS